MSSANALHCEQWKDLCTPTSLQFRAACNAVAGDKGKPVKPRVVVRISQHPDAADLFQKTWIASAYSPDQFFLSLMQGESWKTLVAEAIAGETRWGDLFQGRFQGALDRTLAFIEKLLHPENPIAKSGTVIAAGAASFWVMKFVLPDGALDIPLKPVLGDPKELKVSFSPALGTSGGVIPVEFRMPAGVKEVPVSLAVTAQANPVELRLVARDGQGAITDSALNDVAAQIKVAAGSLSNAAGAMKTLNDTVASFNGASISENVIALNNDVRELVDAYSKQSEKESLAWTSRLHTVTNASLTAQQRIPVELRAGTSASIPLPKFDMKSGAASYEVLTVCVGDIKSSKPAQLEFQLLKVGEKACPSKLSGTMVQGDGEDFGERGWRMTLISVARKVMHGNVARVTFTPTVPHAQSEPISLHTLAQPPSPVPRALADSR
jgi:hypothetical protein